MKVGILHLKRAREDDLINFRALFSNIFNNNSQIFFAAQFIILYVFLPELHAHQELKEWELTNPNKILNAFTLATILIFLYIYICILC